jgi:hypothetical protein
MRLARLYLCLLCFALPRLSRASNLYIHAELPTEITASDIIAEYQIDHGAKSACSSYDAQSHLLCSINAVPGARDVRLEVSLPGYRKYVRALPQVVITPQDLSIELNTLNFQRSSVQVVGVERKDLDDGSARFLINLHQQNKDANINVWQLVIKSDFRDPNTLCAALTVPKATFVIKDQFLVSRGRLEGKFYEDSDKQASAPVTGTIVGWQCPKKSRYLELNLQTIIGLRGNDTVIAVVLPRDFKIVEGYQLQVPNPEYSSPTTQRDYVDPDLELADSKKWEDLSLSVFRNFEFKLMLKGDEETTIVAKYPSR